MARKAAAKKEEKPVEAPAPAAEVGPCPETLAKFASSFLLRIQQ